VSQRSILLWYVISLVTLGIGGLVWYFKLNKDAKQLSNNKGWSPGLSVLAVTVGAIIIIPAIVSQWRTWSRVREVTGFDGLSAGIQFCLIFIPIVNIAYMGYLQSKLNQAIGARSYGAAVSPA
jgi:hypothetical protein